MGKAILHLILSTAATGAMLAAPMTAAQKLRVTAQTVPPVRLAAPRRPAPLAPRPLTAPERSARYRQATGDQSGDASGRPVRYQLYSAPPGGYMDFIGVNTFASVYPDLDLQPNGAVRFAADQSGRPTDDVFFIDCAIDIAPGGRMRWVSSPRGNARASVGGDLTIADHRAVFAIDMRQMNTNLVTLLGDKEWTFRYCDVTTVK